jgi:hypothetical protein
VKKPINTVNEHDPLGFLFMGMAMGASGAIEHQEAQGQRSFVASETLPSDIREEYRKVLEAAGVKFIGPVEDDPLFQYVELPEGWKKEPTDHSMWSRLVDDKGRKRAMIFYKAAFYDRKAHLHAEPRYSIRFDYDRDSEKLGAVSHVLDGEAVIYSTDPFPVEGLKSYQFRNQADASARAWLSEHFPNWKDNGAYWD